MNKTNKNLIKITLITCATFFKLWAWIILMFVIGELIQEKMTTFVIVTLFITGLCWVTKDQIIKTMEM